MRNLAPALFREVQRTGIAHDADLEVGEMGVATARAPTTAIAIEGCFELRARAANTHFIVRTDGAATSTVQRVATGVEARAVVTQGQSSTTTKSAVALVAHRAAAFHETGLAIAVFAGIDGLAGSAPTQASATRTLTVDTELRVETLLVACTAVVNVGGDVHATGPAVRRGPIVAAKLIESAACGAVDLGRESELEPTFRYTHEAGLASPTLVDGLAFATPDEQREQ
jgi:hypothetical protein